MSDQLESGSEVSGGGNDTPPGQEPQSDQPTSTGTAGLTEERVLELIEKQWQSGKDRRFAQIEKAQETTQSELTRIRELVKKGLTDDQIQRELWIDKQMAASPQVPQSEPSPVRGGAPPATQQPGSVDYRSIITGEGLEPNDPAFLDMVRDYGSSVATFTAAVKGYAKAKGVTPPKSQPTGAGGIAPPGTPPPGPPDENQLMTRFTELAKDPVKNAAEMAKVKEQLGWA